MPPVVAAVAVYFAISEAAATLLIITTAISAASIAFAAYAMANMPGYSSAISGRTQVTRSAISPHRVIYGQCMVSGPLVASFSYGPNNHFLYLVIVLASHEVEEIGTVYVGDVLSTDVSLNSLALTYDSRTIPAGGTVATSQPIGSISAISILGVPSTEWAALTVFNVGDTITPSASVFYYTCTTSGTSGITEPEWGTTADGTTADGAVVWTAYLLFIPSSLYSFDSNSQAITFDPSLVGQLVQISYYRALVKITRYLGTQTQGADPELMANARDTSGNLVWTAQHTLTGRAYIVVRLEFNTTAFPSGIPNLKAVVRGVNNVKDPRVGKSITNVVTGTMLGAFILGLRVQVTCPGHGFDGSVPVFIVDVGGAVEVNDRWWYITVIDADNFHLQQPVVIVNGWSTRTSPYTGGGLASTVSPYSYSDNAALCIRDYLAKGFGLNCTSDDINDDSFVAAANISDEAVPVLAGTGNGYTTDNVGYEVGRTILHLISGTGTILPGDTVTITVVDGYYLIDGTGAHLYSADPKSGYTYYPASSYSYTVGASDAYANDVGLDPNGLLTLASGLIAAVPPLAMAVTVSPSAYEPRYTCNGSFTLDGTPADILKKMLTACAGRLVWSQGKYSLVPASYNYPVVTLTESDLRDDISVTPAPSLRQKMNTVRGTFVSPADFWTQIDFPFQRDATAYGLDGVELAQNLELPYTTSSATAQRLANIFLQQSLHGMTVTFPAKLTAFRLQPGDVVYLNIAQLGWVEKQFRVQDWTLSDSGGVDLLLREESPDIYGWISSQQTPVAYPPAAYISAPTTVALPVYADNASALAGGLIAGQQYRTSDGVVHVVY